MGLREIIGTREIADEVRAVYWRVHEVDARLTTQMMLTAKVAIAQTAARGVLDDLREAEFKVFSQFGEDGIIQYLIRRAKIPRHLQSFVEFGVESYLEANTRFLLMNDLWRGLVLDGDPANVKAIENHQFYWLSDLKAVATFIDADNINDVIRNAGHSGEIGLLSIDIDGVDYWVWEKLDVVNPIIVIAEYNSVFGAERAVTVPYDPAFVRQKAHYSYLYAGCSLKALEMLARRKGYSLVGSNSAGNNAFFVRDDHLNDLRALTTAQAYVESRFRESRDPEGRMSYISGADRLREIGDMPLVDLETNATIRAAELLS